jgi:hypothetical protein
MIIDTAFPECILGYQYKLQIPFMYIHTVPVFAFSLSDAGIPAPYSITPYVLSGFSRKMNFIDRTINTITYATSDFLRLVSVIHTNNIFE